MIAIENQDVNLCYMLYNNFLYTQLAFVFDLQKDFCIGHPNIDAFFSFLLQKN